MTLRDQDFELWQGENKLVYFTITGDSSAVKDLTGSTAFAWKALRHVGSTSAAITKSLSTGGITVTGATSGIFCVTLSSSDTESINGRFYHEARITDIEGKNEVVATGILIINRSGTL